ncbi:MAG: hypothetical protein ACLR8Y_08365 [Alistipes indistinctus]
MHTGVSIRHYLPGSGTAPAQHKSPATAATARRIRRHRTQMPGRRQE